MVECLSNFFMDEHEMEREAIIQLGIWYNDKLHCFNCGACNSPLWRNAIINNVMGEDVRIRLCNACGLKHAQYPCDICGGTYDRIREGKAYCIKCGNKLL